MNDLLLEEIKAAYDTHALWPIRGTIFLGCFACPLAALAVHRGVVDPANPELELNEAKNPAFVWACCEFGEDWTFGFIDAFDDGEKSQSDSVYLAGYEFGEQVLEHLFPRQWPF